MFKFKMKIFFLALSATSAMSIAEEAKKDTQAGLHTQVCPSDFYTLPVIPEARFCQQFSDTPPASLTYHTEQDQILAKDYYLEKVGTAESVEQLKGRIVLQYHQGKKIVIISADGKGSQIDILVKG